MDDLPQEARKPDSVAAVEELKKLSHNDPVLDYRVVDTRDSFAEGTSIRKMAEQAGLLDLYRRAYSRASGGRALRMVVGHLVPSRAVNPGGHVDFETSWVNQLNTLIRISLQILETDEKAGHEAVPWLDGEQSTMNRARAALPIPVERCGGDDDPAYELTPRRLGVRRTFIGRITVGVFTLDLLLVVGYFRRAGPWLGVGVFAITARIGLHGILTLCGRG